MSFHPNILRPLTNPRKTKINPRLIGAMICIADVSLLATRLLAALELRLAAEGDCTGIELTAQIVEECGGNNMGRGSAGTQIREPPRPERANFNRTHARIERGHDLSTGRFRFCHPEPVEGRVTRASLN